MKTALITGITGQDGSYLAEFLLKKGYKVHGIIRRASSFNTGRIEHLYFDAILQDKRKSVTLHYGDMTDGISLYNIIYFSIIDSFEDLKTLSEESIDNTKSFISKLTLDLPLSSFL